MKLETLKPAEGSVKSSKRIGRGEGSKKGGTSTKGHKGAQSRSGYSRKLGFEGGQMPLQRRVPKYGFKNPFRVAYKAVNLDKIQEVAEKKGTELVDKAFMVENGLIKKKDLVKVLGRGEYSAKLTVKADKFSKSAIEMIEKAGGKAETI